MNHRIQAVHDVTMSRIAHINDLKTNNVEPSSICTLQVLADDIPRDAHSFTQTGQKHCLQPAIQSVFDVVVTDRLGTTTIVKANIDTEEGKLVCLPHYRIPKTKRDLVKQKIDK